MIKKGLNLFTSTGYAVEKACYTKTPCCDVCITPSLILCRFICKYRKATMIERDYELRRKFNNDNR